MSLEFLVRKRALDDMSEALEWYQDISKELGEKYLSSVEDRFEFLEQFPEAFQVRYNNVRMAPLNKFPFAIHYMIDESKIVILRVLHTKRNPVNWKNY